MQAGRLDRLITIQRKTRAASDSGSGDDVETWTTIANRRAASVAPVRGEERFVNPQIVAQNLVEFRIRYSSDVAEMINTGPLFRIVYPALGTDSPQEEPAVTQIHDVQQVNEIGRREGLQMIALRRTDVPGS